MGIGAGKSKTRIQEGIGDKFNVREHEITFDTIMNGVTLYHRPKDGMAIVGGKKMSIADSVFKYGFNREFTRTNGGNLYGAGVYSVYTLRSSNEKARGYGGSIIKLKLIGGYQDFLIFSKQLAQQTYGDRWHITQQIFDIFPKDIAQKILDRVTLIMHNDKDDFSHMSKSSQCAYEIIRLLGENTMNATKCRGLVYNGGHDGACCFIRDFSSAVPIEISRDNGKHWENRLSQELIDRLNTEVDTYFQLGGNKQFAQVSDKAINGYVMVWNKEGKVNYVPANSNDTISNIWFDNGENWEIDSNGNPYTNVAYHDYYLTIALEDGQYMVYDQDGCPLDCTINDIPNLIS